MDRDRVIGTAGPGGSRSTPGDAAQLLLVEDNESQLRMLSDYLQAKGYRVEVARDGIEAVQQSKALRPDLILMDIHLPRLDGLEAIQMIREDDVGGGSPSSH